MILAVTNQKGGTGKSTIATNLAVCFAHHGAEVLLVDADPQHSALDWRTDRPDAVPLIHVVGLPIDNLHRHIPPGQEVCRAPDRWRGAHDDRGPRRRQRGRFRAGADAPE